jgi:hypothetical protein
MGWNLTEPTSSLEPGSKSVYVRGHIRVTGKVGIRLQGVSSLGISWEENVGPVSRKLVAYVKAIPHTCPSVAKTATSYAPCLLRRENATGAVRVQIAGPESNRPWGMEFVIPKLVSAKHLPSLDPTCIPPMAFAIGDEVVIVKEGDGNGCQGGPAVGTVGHIVAIEVIAACGPFVFKHEHGKWYTTAAHLAKVEPTSTEPKPSWAVFGFASRQAVKDFEMAHNYDATATCPACEDNPLGTCYQIKRCATCKQPFGDHNGGAGKVRCNKGGG